MNRALRLLHNLINLTWALLCPAIVPTAWAHPLDPLTIEEIELVRALVRQQEPEGIFVTVALSEPPKEEVYGWAPGKPFSRVAEVVLLKDGARKLWVDLTAKKVARTEVLPGKQPFQTDAEYAAITDLVRADPEWQAAMRKRGIADFEKVYVNIWAFGNERYPGSPKRRLMRAVSTLRGGQTNAYGPSIEGVEVIVQCDPLEVLEVIDTGARPLAPDSTDFFDPAVRGERLSKLKPLIVQQPQGESFKIQGSEVQWDNWRFRFSLHPRDGLVLHNVRVVERGTERQILYRASVSEMMVPYGDPEKTWAWRAAMDAGEYGLGGLAAPLEHGKTAPRHARLLGVTLANEDGMPEELPARIAIYERHGENLWSHWDYDEGAIGRRGRELVIGFIATIGNYDYGLSWIFKRDGSIEFMAELTGILLTKGVEAETCASCEGRLAPGCVHLSGDERFGTLVARNTVAVNHQHFINLRLDFDIEGRTNAVKEFNAEREGWFRNRSGNVFVANQRIFGKEREARRDASAATHRHWAILNPNRKTALGHYPSYVIEPGASAWPFMKAGRLPRKIAGFADHQFFATRFDPGQLYAAGEFPGQSLKPENVVTWGDDNESIFNEDVVAWVTVGLTHVPRPEEYPVMPAARAGFKLLPKGFFDRNPALDISDEE